MTDTGLQLDMFRRVRAPRVQLMSYRDRGWNARGEEVVWFECPKCGTELMAVSAAAVTGVVSDQAAMCRIERLAYAPADNLEEIDVALIGAARRRVDMAAYVLTNVSIVEALDAAAARGVTIRLYRDGADIAMPRPLARVYDRLVARPNVEARYKAEPAPFMHLKAYTIDSALLREGAGNFSHSGLTRQDNSLIALRCEAAVTRFQTAFETMWRR